MWKNMVNPDRPQMTIWRMRIACCIPKATHIQTHTHTHNHSYIHTHTHTHTHRICNSYCFSTETKVMRARVYFTLHVQCLSCYNMLLNIIFWNSADVVYSQLWPYCKLHCFVCTWICLFIAWPLKQWLHERALMLRDSYFASPYYFCGLSYSLI